MSKPPPPVPSNFNEALGILISRETRIDPIFEPVDHNCSADSHMESNVGSQESLEWLIDGDTIGREFLRVKLICSEDELNAQLGNLPRSKLIRVIERMKRGGTVRSHERGILRHRDWEEISVTAIIEATEKEVAVSETVATA